MLYSLRHIAPHRKFAHELHLDIFEHIIPPSLIADVLSETHSWEEREKTLNMPMVMAIIIAMGLLASCSIPHVLHKLAQGLRYIWPDPSLRLPGASAISQRRRQLGVKPLRRLFERVCKQAGSPFPRPRPEHRQLPKLKHPFAEVIVLIKNSTRYHGPQPFKPFPRVVRLN